MGPGPSRIPYDPGSFVYPDGSSSARPLQQQQQPPQYPSAFPPPLDRAFDSGNYHGMTSPTTDPSTNILTPGYPFSNPSQQHIRDPFSNNGTQILNSPLPQPGYTYPTDNRPVADRRRQSKNEGEWSEYNQLGVQPGPSYRPFMPVSR